MRKIILAVSTAWEWMRGKKTYFFGALMILGAIGNLASAIAHGQIIVSVAWIITHWQTVSPYWMALNLGFAVLTGRAAIPDNYQPLSVRLKEIRDKHQGCH